MPHGLDHLIQQTDVRNLNYWGGGKLVGGFWVLTLEYPLPQIQLLPPSSFHTGTPTAGTGTSLPLCSGIFF